MKSAKYSMEYFYRSPWISNKFINDSSRNWILTKLSDHIGIPISYFIGLAVSENWETDSFRVHVDGLRNLNLIIWTYRDTLNGLFSKIFWLRKEKKNNYPLYKISYVYLKSFFKKKDKNRDKEFKWN